MQLFFADVPNSDENRICRFDSLAKCLHEFCVSQQQLMRKPVIAGSSYPAVGGLHVFVVQAPALIKCTKCIKTEQLDFAVSHQQILHVQLRIFGSFCPKFAFELAISAPCRMARSGFSGLYKRRNKFIPSHKFHCVVLLSHEVLGDTELFLVASRQ